MAPNQRQQIVMPDAEAFAYIERRRTATMASIGPAGLPHLVAMWYGIVEGKIAFETKARSQKAINLRRDPRIGVLIESGDTYDQLQGVAIEGRATVIEDEIDERYWRTAISVHERYIGPYSDDLRPTLAPMMRNRVAIVVEQIRVRSWDHRKLGLPPQPYAGSTAAG